jgi:hypothetical protein
MFMSKKLLLFFAMLCVSIKVMAQVPIPEACEPVGTTVPAENCPSACINCDFNGYMGNSGGWAGDPEPLGWCSDVQNDQWLGFIAGTAGATFSITPSNCVNGNGLQAAVYPAGCNDNPLGCNAGCMGCGGLVISFSVTMIPGNNYYLIIDGFAQDDCDFTISVVPPIAVEAQPLGPVGAMTGPNTICPGGTASFAIPSVNQSGFYTWTSTTPGVQFNGVESPATFEAPGGRQVQVTIPSGATGNVTICVEPSNSCFTGMQRCKTITIQPIPPTVLPKAVVCFEDAPYTLPWGDEVNVSGTYQTTFTSFQGCDSIVRQMVQVLPPKISNQTKYVCQGDCVSICGSPYCDSGVHIEVCDSYQGCDSTVSLTLNVLNPIAQILGNPVLSCSNTSLTLTSAPSPNTPAPSIKVWRSLPSNMVINNGATAVVTQPGTYYLTTTMSLGGIQCIKYDTVVVTGNTTPPVVTAVNGAIGCASGPSQISVTSNAANPTYAWSAGVTPSNIQSPTVTAGGSYTVTVTDNVTGCTASAVATVVGNTAPPVIATTNANINCTTPLSQVSATSNVASTFAWNGPASGTGPNLNVSAPGVYVVTVTSTFNGCTAVASATVTDDFAAPGAIAGAAGTISCTTPSVTLNGSSPTAGVTYAWSAGTTGAGASVTANTAGTYTVTVTGANGCTSTATVALSGNTNAPNAATSGLTLSCNTPSQSLVASSSTPNVSYAWNINGTTVNSNTAIVNLPGNYTVTVTAVNDCTATASALVNGDFAAPNASATGATINCGINTVNIVGSSTTPGVTYSWVGPGGTPYTGQTVAVGVVGNYTLVVEAANGCTTTAVATVVPDANVPNVSAIGDTINCLSASATIVGASTTPGVTFNWTYNGTPLPDPTLATQNVTQSGLYTLSIINPSNGCTAIATAFVTLDTDAPGAATQGATLTCASSSLDLTATSPTNNVTYTWTGNVNNQILSVGSSGTYTVTVTGLNGCTSTAVAVVQADQGIPVLSTAASILTCANQVVTINTTSSLPVDYSWNGPVGFLPTSQQSPQVTLPGTYTVTATNATNGCSATTSITINQDIAAPNASANGGVLTCVAPNLALGSASTTPGVSFFWPALMSSVQNPSVSVIGTYAVEVTGLNGCVSTATAAVTENKEAPMIDIALPAELTCANLNVLLDATITTIDPANTVANIDWSTSGTTEDITVTTPGSYSVVVLLNNGCFSDATIVVNQDIAPPAVMATGGTLSCNFPTINISGSSSTQGSSIVWSNNLGTTNTPSVNTGGTYTVTATGANGCTATASAVVATDFAPPGAAIVSTNVITCNDQNATLTANTTATGSIQYNWEGPNVMNAATPSVVAISAGTYSVIITGTNGCTSSSTFAQTDNLVPPSLSTTNDTIDCTSGQGNISAISNTPGVTYKWENEDGDVISQLPNPTVFIPGTYSVTVTGTNGCISTATAVVEANQSSPNIDISNASTQLTCDLTSIELIGSTTTANTTIEWTLPNNTNSTNASLDATAPGQYSFMVTSNTNGCVSVETVTISQDITPPGNVTASTGTLTCTTQSLMINGNSDVSNAAYSWIGPGGVTFNVISPTVNTPGTYALTVTDPTNGCTATTSTEVDQSNDLPPINVTTETITCFEPVVTLDATTNVANAQFTWTGPQFNSPLQDPTTNKPGSYTVVVKDPSNGCTSTFSIEVIEDKVLPNITVQNAQITCQQPSVTLQGNSTTANVTYLWTAPNGQTLPPGANPTVSEAGNYILVVTNTVNGCSSNATATVSPDQNVPVVTVTGGEITCKDPDVGLTGSTNKPDVTWLWDGPGTYTSTEQNPTITVAGTYTLIVTTPINGCTGQASVVVTEDIVLPAINAATPDQLNCTTTQVNLQASVVAAGNYTYVWTTTNGTILSGATSSGPTVSQAGAYVVVVTNTDNGCTSTRTVDVTVDAAVPSAIANNPKDVSCYGFTNGSVQIEGVTGGTAPFLFSIDNQPFISASAFGNLPPGEHNLRVQDANGCEFETLINIGEPQELVVNLGPDTTINLGDTLKIYVNGDQINNFGSIETFSVSPVNLDTLLNDSDGFVPKYTFLYKITAVDSNGCRSDDSRVVIVDRTRRIFVPNVFVPDGSGNNDRLRIFGGNDVEQFKSFTIYDRWGEVVYQARNFAPNDNNVYWDGKVRGQIANPAVFIYSLQVLFKDGEIELFTGDISVAR